MTEGPFETRQVFPTLFLFLGATLLVYWRTLGHGFMWDDDFNLYQNPFLDGLNGLKYIWFSHNTPQYYPLVYTSFWIQKRLWGLNPAGYHAVSLLLHGLNAYLVYRVLHRIYRPAALLTAMAFVVHPLQADTVCWITEQKNLLAMFFFLLACLRCDRFIESGKRSHYAQCLLLFCLGLLSKTIVVCFAAVPLLLTWLKGRRIGKRDLWLIAPFILIGALAGAHTAYLERYLKGASGWEWHYNFVERALLAASLVWFYIYKTIFPLRLIFLYPKWAVNASSPLLWLSAALLIALAAFLFRSREKLPRAWLAGMIFFVVSIFPALGFANIYSMRYSHAHNHFLYLSMPALVACLIVAPCLWLEDKMKADPPASRCARGLPWLIILLLGIKTLGYAEVFRNNETLWGDTLKKNPSAWLAATNLSAISIERGDWANAETLASRALSVDPQSYEAQNDLGVSLYHLGEFQKAAVHFDAAVQIQPDSADAWFCRGMNFKALGDSRKAEECLKKTISIDPLYWKAMANLGELASESGDWAGAETMFDKAVSIYPQSFETQNNLGLALCRLGKLQEARGHFQIALKINPNYTDAWIRCFGKPPAL